MHNPKDEDYFDVILPNIPVNTDNDEFKICEPFIHKLLHSDSAKFNIKIDSKSPVVLCNDLNVKRVLDLYLRVGMLVKFHKKFIELLHERNESKEYIGELRVLFKDNVVRFKVVETKGLPNFIWKIEKIKL